MYLHIVILSCILIFNDLNPSLKCGFNANHIHDVTVLNFSQAQHKEITAASISLACEYFATVLRNGSRKFRTTFSHENVALISLSREPIANHSSNI